MRVHFHVDVEAEVGEAVEFYDRESPTAGAAFEAELERIVAEIRENPYLGSPALRRARRRLLQGFPYAVLYQVRPGDIHVFAVAHFSRQWGYWLDRIDPT